MSVRAWWFLGLIGCAGSGEDTADSAGGVDSQAPAGWSDAILDRGHIAPEFSIDHHAFMGAASLDDERALFAGYRGFTVASMADASLVAEVDLEGDHGARIAYDATTGHAWVATYAPGLIQVDARDPTAPVALERMDFGQALNRAVAADEGAVLLSTSVGVQVVDPDGVHRASIPLEMSLGVALAGDRALIADGDALTLWDLSDPGAPAELDRTTMSGNGWHVDFDGERVAVALGGNGAAALRVEDDRLVAVGDLITPAATYGVALDDGHLWTASWSQIGLARFDDQGVSMLSHEPSYSKAMGVAAAGGRALVGELDVLHAVERVDGAEGPEIDAPEQLWFAGVGDTQPVTFTNGGAATLQVEIAQGDGYSADPASLTLAPGEAAAALVALTDGGAALRWTSDDPDEPEGEIALAVSDQNVGQPHADFELPGFTWPDPTVTSHRLSDHLGSVVVLSYFATW